MSKSTIEDVDGLISGLLTLDPKDADLEAQVRARCLGALSRLSTAKYVKAGDVAPTTGIALASKRQAISRYRAAIRARVRSKDVQELALRYMRLKDSDQAKVHEASRNALVEQHHGRRPLDVARHIAIARTVLQKVAGEPLDVPKDGRGATVKGYVTPLEIAAALIAVTGRRPIEVLQDLRPQANGFDFAPVTNSDPTPFDPGIGASYRWTVMFSGQRKTREAESAQTEPYQIPVLVEPALVLHAIAALRARYSCVGLTSVEVQDKAGKNLGRYAKGGEAGFADQVGPGYHDREGDPLTPKDLRAAYATCAYEQYAPQKLSWNAYAAKILGHSEKDLLTSFSYDVFFPWGSKRPYEDEVAIAARETFAALEAQRAIEADERVRAKIEHEIATVKARLGED